MGEAKNRKQRFLAKHTKCCFCGGCAIATEEDHQPGRVFFRDRHWPEGFVFPACANCNRASRDAENLVSIIVADPSTPTARANYQARIASVRTNYPHVIPSLFDLTANDKRRALRQLGWKPRAGQTYAQTPMIRLDEDFWYPHLRLVALKIMLAFHYKAFGSALSKEGCVWLDIRTNGDNLGTDWFRYIREITGRLEFPTRANRSLLDQFTCQWDMMYDHKVAMFLVTLQKRLVFTGLTTEEPGLHVFPDERNLLNPLSHS